SSDVPATIPSPATPIELTYLGGAATHVAADETAFGDRSAPFITNLLANWTDASEDELHIAWIRSVFQMLRPAMRPGVYVNFMSGDERTGCQRFTSNGGSGWSRSKRNTIPTTSSA